MYFIKPTDPYPITPKLAVDASRMSQYMIQWASRAVANPASLGEPRHVKIMADGIRQLARNT